MHDATERIEAIETMIKDLVEDAESGQVYLPEVPRLKVCNMLLGGVLIETRRRERRRGPIPRGGLDRSVPAGDRA